MHLRLQHYCVIALITGAVMLSNLGGPRLWDRDEPRNAGCAAEMLARGDWVVPVFNAEQRTHKPVLLYWLMMAAYSVLGVNEFSARLPSAMLSIGTALCTYEMGRRLFSARAGMWGGLAVATSLMFVVAGRAATPDATLIFCSTLSLTVFVTAVFRTPSNQQTAETLDSVLRAPSIPRNWLWSASMYASMAGAVLAKGPVGLVLPTAVIGMFLLIMRLAPPSHMAPMSWSSRQYLFRALRVFEPRHFLRTCWSMRPLTAVAICLLVAAPWYVWVGLRTDGQFLRSFFFEHNLGRAMQTMEGHRGNVLFYPVAILVGFFPWSVFAAPLLIDLVRRIRANDPWRAGYILAACWVGVYVGVFSLARTKLPSYVTPCYPALALLTGAFVDRFLAGACQAPRYWQYAAFSVFAVVGVVFTGAIPFAARQFFPGDEWLGLVGIIPLMAGIACLFSLQRKHDSSAMYSFLAGAAVFFIALFAVAADRAGRHQMQDRLWTRIDRHSNTPRVAAFACLEPSWVFYGKHPIEEISHEQVGPTHSPWVFAEGKWTPKSRVSIPDVLKGPYDPFIITTGAQLERVRKLLPEDFQILEKVPFFLQDDELVLLGRPKQSALADRTENPRR